MLVAGVVSGAVYAQTNVTVYGRVDLSYVYSKSDYRKFQGIETGSGLNGGQSHIGFKGEEALGNGLKAIFKLEWGNADDVGGAPTSDRYSYVGLAGNFGQVIAGRVGTPNDTYFGATGVQSVNGYEANALFRGKLALMAANKWSNAISYISPSFSGLDFTATYSFGEKVNRYREENNGPGKNCGVDGTDCNKNADTSDASKFGLGVRYANGPLYLTAVYQARRNDNSTLDPTAPDEWEGYGAKGWAVGGSYDFKVVKVYANYVREKANHKGLAYDDNDAGSDKQTMWSLGVGIPVSSAGTVSLEYAQYKDYLNHGIRAEDAEIPFPSNPYDLTNAKHKAKGYTVGYRHNLSNRTWLHAYLTRIHNQRGIAAGWNGTSATGVAGENQTIFSTGIVHVF
jgi:predicted porin